MNHKKEILEKMAIEIDKFPEKEKDTMIWLAKNIKTINESAELLPLTLEEAQKLYEIAMEKDNHILMILAKTKIIQAEMKTDK